MLALSPQRAPSPEQRGRAAAERLLERRDEFETASAHLAWLEQVVDCFAPPPGDPTREAVRVAMDLVGERCREERLRRNECPGCRLELRPRAGGLLRLFDLAPAREEQRECRSCWEVF